jgi:hypothetical protein
VSDEWTFVFLLPSLFGLSFQHATSCWFIPIYIRQPARPTKLKLFGRKGIYVYSAQWVSCVGGVNGSLRSG